MLQASRRAASNWLMRWLHVAAVVMTVVLSLGALGADCSPSPPACGVDGGMAAGCPQGQHRVCLNRCVTYVGSGSSCSLDHCTGDVCAANLACVPASSGSLTGTCQTPVSDLGCDPTSTTTRCFEGTFCQTRGTQAQVDAHTACALTISAQNGKAGLCVTPAREGEHCDGEWNTVMAGSSSLICSPCEPGMACVGGICQRKCTADEDCPCTSPDSGLGCRTALPGSGTRVCDLCRGDGMNCQGIGRPNFTCCNALSSCNAQHGTFECCRASGASCDINVAGQCCEGKTCQGGTCQTCVALGSNATDARVCCGTDRRVIGGVCAACRVGGQTAGSASECCSGLTFDSALGICKTGCTQDLNSWCSVSGAMAGSQCAIGRVTDCDPMTGAPVCTAVSGPTSEVCDGVDNDCDGMTDEDFGVGNTCLTPVAYEDVRGSAVTPCLNQTANVHGHLRCDRAHTGTQCTAIQDYDYCTICGPGGSGPTDMYGRTTMNCGACPGNPGDPCSSPSNLCTPNGHCNSFGGMYNCYNSTCLTPWACWSSADIGTESCPQ